MISVLFLAAILSGVLSGPVAVSRQQSSSDIRLGSCIWVVDRQCPDTDVNFYLYTRQNPNDRQAIFVDDTWDKSNLSYSNFDPDQPTKIIIHGFNSDMFLTPLIDMKDEYLQRSEYNLFFVDYSVLAKGPCYISAAHNIQHVGKCIGQLVDRILDTGTTDIHLIGFSLGGQTTNYVAQAVKPFVIPRITGLDPALPLFVGVPKNEKLDSSDAKFVDVFHTNALIQGKIEQCGHVDFYFNGGIIQPGCYSWSSNPAACSHQRAPSYFMESIRSYSGFWGWGCSSYINYLLGFCPPTNYLVLAGEDCPPRTRGMYLVKTNDKSPYAIGKWTGAAVTRINSMYSQMLPLKRKDPLLENIDQWGKLDGDFNNLENFPTPVPQDPNIDWPYFNHMGSGQITHQLSQESDQNSNDIYNPSDPYQIEVVEAVRKKIHLPVTAPENSTHSLLIQKLYEDFNHKTAPSRGHFPNRQPINNNAENFFTLPVLIKDNKPVP